MIKVLLLIGVTIGALFAQAPITGCSDPTEALCTRCRSDQGWKLENDVPGRCVCSDGYVPDDLINPTSCQDNQLLFACIVAPQGNPPQWCWECDRTPDPSSGVPYYAIDQKNPFQCTCNIAEGYIPQMLFGNISACVSSDTYPEFCVQVSYVGENRCSRCADGYLFNGFLHTQCILYDTDANPGCLYASSDNVCSKCGLLYKESDEAITTCYEYTSGADNCLYASAPNQCYQCEDGYLPDGPEYNNCYPDPGVKLCLYAGTNPPRCTQCQAGYYLDEETGNCYAFGKIVKIGLSLLIFVAVSMI